MAGGLYGVRQAASRAMAAVAPREFEALCLTWGELADPSAVELRQRAAEGVAGCRSDKVFQCLSGLASVPNPQYARRSTMYWEWIENVGSKSYIRSLINWGTSEEKQILPFVCSSLASLIVAVASSRGMDREPG
jgi:hypothetical protein